MMHTDTISADRNRPDLLLLAARILIWVLLAGIVLTIVMTAVALGIELISNGGALIWTSDIAAWRPVLGLVLALAALSLIARAAMLVLQLIDTVPAGEAFCLANIRRLEAIAGLILVLQCLGEVGWRPRIPFGGDINGFDISVALSPGGVALVLLLFILARVFRHGAVMREDLKGTV